MKKLVKLSVLCTTAIMLAACGSKDKASTAATTSETTNSTVQTEEMSEASASEENAEAVTVEDLGEGSFFVSTEAGTSENGEIPVFYATEGLTDAQIGYTAEGFDGALLVYIYLDGAIAEITQITELTAATFDLNEGNGGINVGMHTVQFMQFTDNAPTTEPVAVKTAHYEVQPS
ncbi:hypothetical protein M2139_001021 [Enterococcus sp. PF1-24]|uniref:hypothetical protein n=1 Tax=unclassified Enterococcus TaxID=2608891 RepID=UPI00247623BB|nr:MULTISPECIES: hypothetical protein [unclassified Enterococcus]MDH6364036.1 hypothetical protein [Enterococcus sp. PFB1-1]MDH6401137.1 hypothetical protein [Enterococcus sp. PF1-24]